MLIVERDGGDVVKMVYNLRWKKLFEFFYVKVCILDSSSWVVKFVVCFERKICLISFMSLGVYVVDKL